MQLVYPGQLDPQLTTHLTELLNVRHQDTVRSRPKILVPAYRFESYDGRWPSVGMITTYVDAVTVAGGDPYLLTNPPLPPGIDPFQWVWDTLLSFDGLLLCGGGDVEANWYGEPPHPQAQNPDRWRDWWEWHLVHLATVIAMPVLAICRGMQLWNVALGGTLWQDLMAQPGGTRRLLLQHRRPGRIGPGGFREHAVWLDPSSRLAALLGTDSLPRVRCMHHQALNRVADLLRVCACSRDRVIEGVERRDDGFGVAVQFHPEEDAGSASTRLLFGGFVRASAAFAGGRSTKWQRLYEAIRAFCLRAASPGEKTHVFLLHKEGGAQDGHVTADVAERV